MKDNQAQFQLLVDQHPDPVFSLDPSGNFNYVNKAAEDLTGYRKEELIGKRFSNFCEQENDSCIEGHYANALKSISYSFEVCFLTYDGVKLNLSLTNMPIVDTGEITGIFCIAKDITDHKRMMNEKELIYTIGKLFQTDDHLKYCLNQTLYELCAYTHSHVGEAWLSTPDQKGLELFTEYNVDKPGNDVQVKSKLGIGMGLPGKSMKEQQPVYMEDLLANNAFLRKELANERQLQSGMAVPLLYQEEVIGVLCLYVRSKKIKSETFQLNNILLDQLANNIHHKRTEEELSGFFSLCTDILCVLGTDGYLKKVNGSFREILGYSKAELLNHRFVEFIHPESREFTDQIIGRLAESSPTVHFENQCLTKDGQIIWIQWTLTSHVEENFIYCIGRNITEAKKLEMELQNEKNRFLEMFNNAPVMMCILLGPDLVFASANAAYYKFSGRKNIIGQSVRKVFPEAEGQGIFEIMTQVYQTGEVYTIGEKWVQLITGDEGLLEDFYLSFMYQPYRNAEGVIEGIFYFGVDVTEQVVARKKIEESKKQYVSLIQNLPVAVYTCDAEGYVQLFNKAAVSLWGREPEIGISLWCCSWKIYNKDGELIPHEQTPMAISLKERRPLLSEEIQIQKPNGEINPVVAFPSPVFDSTGKLTGGINVLVNISERKMAEEEVNRLSLIATNTINTVIIINPTGKIEWVNDAFTRITGFEFDEAVGRSPGSLLHGKNTDRNVVRLMRQKMKKQESFECELLKYTKSGQFFWVEIQGQPLFDARGKLSHYFIIETDITDRKKAYERLVKTETEIRNFASILNDQLEEERSRIAREIHDEFGQQLTGLKMSLSSLDHLLPFDKKVQNIIAEMMAGIENTIQSLRNFSTELRPGILDTLGLIPSLEWLAQEFEKKNGILCSVKIKVQKPEFSKVLSTAFFRVCQEALTNIWKHANATKVSIAIVQNRNKLSLKIKDNGKGIQTKQLEDPLSMGLIGMRERANLINGRLEINSAINKGTCVHLIAETNG